MKNVEIIGYKRANLGKTDSKKLRSEGLVPSVLYGSGEQIHFAAPMYLFKDIVYTQDVAFVTLNIEGVEKRAILQDIQFHPVSEIILHADFLELADDKYIKMEIPVKFVGTAPGVVAGGKLVPNMRTLKLKALPKDMPQEVEVDISKMELGKATRVKEVKAIEGVEFLNPSSNPIASITIPRALRQAQQAAAAEGK